MTEVCWASWIYRFVVFVRLWIFCHYFFKDIFGSPSCLSEKAMAPHSSTLAWKIPWTEEPGGLQSMGLLRVGHDWATSLSPFTFMHWRGNWQLTPVFLPGESRDEGAWWAAVYGVTQSWTRLKWLSSSSSSLSLEITSYIRLFQIVPYPITHWGFLFSFWVSFGFIFLLLCLHIH